MTDTCRPLAVLLAALAAAACSGSPRSDPSVATLADPAATDAPATVPAAPSTPTPAPTPAPRDPNAPLLEDGRYSYCDPAALLASYPRFTTIPDLVAGLGTGRAYPVIDVHTHLATTTAAEADVQKRAGLYAAVDASFDAVSTAKLRATYAKPNLIQFNLGDYLVGFSADQMPTILSHFDEQKAAGADGVKLFKTLGLEINDATGARLAIDDPRLAPLWKKAADERWTVSIHVGDPNSWLAQYYASSPYSKQDLVKQFTNVVAANPQTVFVAIHLMNLVDAEEELDQLGEFLDLYPNLYTDVAARAQYLVNRDQAHLRAFLLKHQDKILFATDRAADPTDPVQGYIEEFKYWETGQTARGYYMNFSKPGLALPADVLEKLYYRNALRAFCPAFAPGS